MRLPLRLQRPKGNVSRMSVTDIVFTLNIRDTFSSIDSTVQSRTACVREAIAMTSYLKQLRRKIGVVMLFAACAFTMAWVRSQWTFDELSFSIGGGHRAALISSPEGLSWARTGDTFGDNWPRWIPVNGGRLAFDGVNNRSNLQSHSPGFGFHFFVGRLNRITNYRFSAWVMPYFAIVVPLIFASAWLLLGKLRT